MKEDKALELLEAANWKEIIDKLTLYAVWRARRYPWRSGTYRRLPGGQTPEDIAFEAIAKVWQGERSWDPEKYPDLLTHLRWIVKSDLGHLFASTQHLKTKRLSETCGGPEEGNAAHPTDIWASSEAIGSLDPESELILREQRVHEERMKNELYALIKGDEDLELLLLCFEEGLDKPEAIAAQMDWEVSKVYNLKKRLLRRAGTIKERLEQDRLEEPRKTI